jgi:hypothetical protein
MQSDENANGDGNGNGDSHPLAGRDERGRFLPGHPLGGPGSPLAAQAVALRGTWLSAGRKLITPEIAERLVNELLRIATKATRDRDRVAAVATLVDKLGMSLQRVDDENKSGGDFVVHMHFKTKEPPPDDVPPFIDQLPAGPT